METVGDKYMAVSGLPNPSKTHAKNIAKLALDMMDLGSSVVFDGEPVVSKCGNSVFIIKSVACHFCFNLFQ